MKWITLFFLIAMSACRDSTPPVIEICTTVATGGADCRERDGSHVFKTPSEMDNYWCTNQQDEAAFASWAYDAPVSKINAGMKNIQQSMHDQ